MKTEIKELVAEGKVDEALDQLVAFLGGQIDQFSPLFRAAQVAQSEYNQTKEKELQGLLTEDQIRLANNIAINKVLEILEQVDRGGSPNLPTSNQKQWLWYALGGVLVTLIAIFVIKNVVPGAKQEEPVPDEEDSTQVVDIPAFTCPNFSKTAEYPIAIFNFTTLNPKDSATDVLLVGAIDGIFANNGFKGDAALVTNINGPVDLEVAKEMVEKCKARMVIWGRVFDNSEIDLNFYEPQLSSEQQADLANELQFRNQGSFQASIKQAALIIASRVLTVNNSPRAVAVSEQAHDEVMKDNGTSIAAKNSKKSNAASMATMTLANAYAKNKNYKKSIPLYHDILDKKPQDTVARRNLVIAEIKTNNIDVAIKNLDTLRDHQKKEDPVLLDKVGDALTEKGLTRKGAQFKKDAKVIFKRDSVNLRLKQ